MAQTYDIVPEKAGEGYMLANYEAMEASAFEFVKELSLPCEINGRDDYEYAKDCKSKLAKCRKAFQRKRIDVNDILMSDYNNKMRSIERILEAGEDELRGKIERYEVGTLGKEPRKRLIILEIKTYDEEAASKAEAYAKTLGLETRYAKGK